MSCEQNEIEIEDGEMDTKVEHKEIRDQ